jgi:hypothetical protein
MKYAVEYLAIRAMARIHTQIELPIIDQFDPVNSETAEQLEKMILAVPGVIDVYSERYSLTITRAGVYRFDQIIEPVLTELGIYLGLPKETFLEVEFYPNNV